MQCIFVALISARCPSDKEEEFMCGIVGYVGKRQAAPILLDGLEKLEYRGYDSAGIAIMDGNIKCHKIKGRLANLREALKGTDTEGTIGIGHTRWATHGEPSDVNSHPHLSSDGSIAVVHNGIIENYEVLRGFLEENGYTFKSETDSETIPNLIHYYYKGDLLDAVIKATSKLTGSYAICVLCTSAPGEIVAVRKDSPLIVGLRDDEKFVASDIPAVLKETRSVYLLEDNEYVVLKSNSARIFTADKEEISRNIYNVTFDANAAEKEGYDHFMLKEIHEQPKAVRDTLTGRIALGEKVSFDSLTADDIKDVDKIYIIACGTAYHAGLVGKTAIERLAKIPVETDIASEFRYRDPLIGKNNLLVIVSQSGETADTLAAMRLAKSKGAKVLAVTNVVGSTASREADFVFYTHAGPEIAVASTKAYTTQLVAMYTLALFLAENRAGIDEAQIEYYKKGLLELPEKIEQALKNEDAIAKMSVDLTKESDAFFLGRGLDYAVAMEGSLKLKEISYIHSEPYAGGELKHGPIALIEKDTVVIAISTNKELKPKMDSNVKEVVTRGAYVIGVITDGFDDNGYRQTITIPEMNELFTPVVSVVPLQLIAYYVSTAKGLDVDKPRNLAKSVTVE